MLHDISHAIEVKSTRWAVYLVCRDVTAWPSFMPAVKAARIVERRRDGDVVEIAAEVNHEIWTWRSARKFSERAHRITFRRLAPQPPLLSMEGEWLVEEGENAAVRLVLRHLFRLTDETAADFVEQAIRSNANRDLAAIRGRLEDISP